MLRKANDVMMDGVASVFDGRTTIRSYGCGGVL
jgi:hypothetical protein